MYKAMLQSGTNNVSTETLYRVLRDDFRLTSKQAFQCIYHLVNKQHLDLPVASLSEAERLVQVIVSLGFMCDLQEISDDEYAKIQEWIFAADQPSSAEVRQQSLLDKGIPLPYTYIARRLLAEAPDVVRQAVKSDPESSANRLRLAGVMLLEDNPTEAIAQCQQAIRLLDGSAVKVDNYVTIAKKGFAHYLLGCAYNVAGEVSLACNEWQKVVELGLPDLGRSGFNLNVKHTVELAQEMIDQYCDG